MSTIKISKSTSSFLIIIGSVLIMVMFSLVSFFNQREPAEPNIRICNQDSGYTRYQIKSYRDMTGGEYLKAPNFHRNKVSIVLIRDTYIVQESDLCNYSSLKISDCVESNAARFARRRKCVTVQYWLI